MAEKPTKKRTPKPPSTAEIEKRDKQRAAWHEAGHLAVYYVQGGSGHAQIIPKITTDPEMDTTWVGQCSFSSRRPTPAVSIAGEVAVELMEPMIGETWNAEEFAEYYIELGFEAFSPTDRALLPEDENEFREAVQEAHDLLRENWDFFLWCADELMREEVVTNGMADDYQRRIDERPKPTQTNLRQSRRSRGVRASGAKIQPKTRQNK